MRYLEQCLGDLKTAHAHCRPIEGSIHSHQQPAPFRATLRSTSAIEDDSVDEDEEMIEAPSLHTIHPRSYTSISRTSTLPSHQPSISPAILPSHQTSPAIPSQHKSSTSSYGYYSATSSPEFHAQTQTPAQGSGAQSFSLTSPMLRPETGESTALGKDDHEATAALLMLNTDRRSWSRPSGGRGMSVKDLLSG
jgi:hypothetical protein